ncbi:hypothetical protein PYW08_005625 [Mythimna loreyi]|uniref:Uncharacterized protein n=1 Tax=Mythimna loreyi TaxID=667449 RepID=A0ACC2QHJ1_9NEOP|nr:hypothetical protein PYW08_005625 [Mythimna loreyi]
MERLEWRSSAEDIWVTIILKRSRPSVKYNLHLCALYLCKENLGNSYNTQLLNFTNNLSNLILKNPLDKYILLGDFNFGNSVEWSDTSHNGELSPFNITCQCIKDFFDAVYTYSLAQYNNVRNINNRLLDLIFSNDIVIVNKCTNPLALPVDMHHNPLTIQADFVEHHKLSDNLTNKYIFSKGDYTSIIAELEKVNWTEFLHTGSLDDAVAFFYKKLYELRDKFIPLKITKSTAYPSWYNTALIKILKEKYKYHRKYKTYHNLSDYHSFSLLRTRAIEVEKSCFDTYMAKIESAIINNPRSFWSYVKSKRTVNAFPNVMHYRDTIAETGEEICNLFSNYFHSTFQNPDSIVIPSRENNNSVTSISTIEISHEEVLKLMKSLDLTKAGGPDSIPPIFIVSCAVSLVDPVCILFKRSVSEGIVPRVWKSAYITPVFKKGDRSNVEDYRPISKTCLFSKLLERIIYKQVYGAVRSNFGEEQHGFLRNRSTTSNLILSHEFVSEGMDQRAQVDVIYTDYSKCFDRINHTVLLDKLLLTGIHGDLYRWFSSYIENRTQAVVLKGYVSGWNYVPSGVPQGSILGPLLFTLFISDIHKCFRHSYILLYADDMKIHKVAKNISDAEQLQNDLNRFEEYCVHNKLQLNVAKCFQITYSRQKTIVNFEYKLNDQVLNKVTAIKDLGVKMDYKLLFDQHIDYIVNRASKALGFIIRVSADFRSLKTIKILYCAFVRSHLEYASQVWNPQYEKYKSRIEAVQKKFLRYLDYKARQYSDDYNHRCKRYHFLPLHYRRDINDISFFINIANGSIDCPELLSKLHLRTNLLGLRRRPLMQIASGSTNYRKNTFLLRAAQAFNNIPDDLDVDLFCSKAITVKRLLATKFFEDY